MPLIYIDLVTVFDGAQQLDAIERAQIQIRLEVRLRAHRSTWGRAANPHNHLREAACSPRARAGSRGAPLRFNGCANLSEFRFSRRSTREIGFGPQEPAAHPLILRERSIHASDNPSRVARLLYISSIVRRFYVRSFAQQQHAAWFGVSVALQPHDDAVLHFRLAPQCCFEVFRVDVHPRRRNDDVLFAALEIEISLGVECSQIARAEPPGIHSIACNGADFAALPVARRDVRSAHQDFAAGIEFHFAAFQNLADGAAPDLKRMIYADQRSCLCQTVALNSGESDASPEQFSIGVKRSAAGDGRPELPAEPAMNPAKTPHAAQEFFVRG